MSKASIKRRLLAKGLTEKQAEALATQAAKREKKGKGKGK